MEPDLLALGRRAVACPGWRWLPGMLAHHPDTQSGPVLRVRDGWLEWGACGHSIVRLAVECTPDLSDPCTVGGLLALVREVHGAFSYVGPEEDGWSVGASREMSACAVVVGMGDTEAEALVDALETAPKAEVAGG